MHLLVPNRRPRFCTNRFKYLFSNVNLLTRLLLNGLGSVIGLNNPSRLSLSLSLNCKANQMNSIYFIEIKVVMSEHHLRYGCKNVVNIDFEIGL